MKLAPVFLGSLAKRRLATIFSFVAIALGVALGMAVQAVHQAALAEFDRGLRTLKGGVDLEVVGPRDGFDESLYARIASQPSVALASPVVTVDVTLGTKGQSLALVGLDVLAAARLTPALLPRPHGTQPRLAVLDSDKVFFSETALRDLGLKIGESVTLQSGADSRRVQIAGDVPGAAERRLAVADIAGVQDGFGKGRRISRIDLQLARGITPATARAALEPLLPPGVVIETPQAESDQASNLSRAYRVNLAMLATIALVTGGFLVFSAQALSVVRRRSEFAFLRALGLPRARLFAWLVGEGALVGLAGGVAGVGAGYALAWAALKLLGGDLGAGYFTGLAPTLEWDPLLAVFYVFAGVVAGIAGAYLPAREAARVAPAQALKAGDETSLARGSHPFVALALLAASLAACAIPPLDGMPVGGYLAIACLLAGSIVLLPLFAALLARALAPAVKVPVRLAGARLAASPGHSVTAAAGVLTSVALAVAMAIMVSSFRSSVDQWLQQLLPADVYVRSSRATHAGGALDPAQQARITRVAGVAAVSFTRFDRLRLREGETPVVLIARPLSFDARELPVVDAAPRAGSAPDGVARQPAIWASEAMVDLYGWRSGQTVDLPLGGRRTAARVAGIWRDYARQTGAIMIDLADYRRLTGDLFADDAALRLAPGADAQAVIAALGAIAPAGVLDISRQSEIRATSLQIFDRTFAVTYVLEAVAVVIGLAGIAASFAALAAARRREFGMLRHLGLTRRQIGAMLALEGALSAGVGVVAGVVAGAAIGLVLIEVVNRQSFHWSMDLHLPVASIALFSLTLIALAALAAVVSGRLAMQHEAVLAVREDW